MLSAPRSHDRNVTKYTVTTGQPYGGVGNISSDTLDVRAGRKNSAPPAADFSAGLKIINVMGLKNSILSSMPKELNFAVFGTLIFEVGGRSYTCENMHLGMGHGGVFPKTYDNWWIGSKSCLSVPTTHQFSCGCGSIGDGLDFHPSTGPHDAYTFLVRANGGGAAQAAEADPPATATASIPVLWGSYPCEGTCQTASFDLKTGALTTEVKLPLMGINAGHSVAAHRSDDVHFYMGCNSSDTNVCSGATDTQRAIASGEASPAQHRAWRRLQGDPSIWSVITIDRNKMSATVGSTLQEPGEAVAADVWEKTNELILTIGNFTHWVVRSIDPKTGATLRELCSWSRIAKNAYYHARVCCTLFPDRRPGSSFPRSAPPFS